jgi:hypothetical protein
LAIFWGVQAIRTAVAAAQLAAREALYDDEEADCPEVEYDPLPGASLTEVVAEIRRIMPTIFDDPMRPLVPLLQSLGLDVWRGEVAVPDEPWHG